mmetsp:Transcript_80371/g.186633  ORF Transcript_80371/g.186633 Transcript_80371/m.186633 type:complete len:219 (+) Transcript_80371:1203-1859(+)
MREHSALCLVMQLSHSVLLQMSACRTSSKRQRSCFSACAKSTCSLSQHSRLEDLSSSSYHSSANFFESAWDLPSRQNSACWVCLCTRLCSWRASCSFSKQCSAMPRSACLSEVSVPTELVLSKTSSSSLMRCSTLWPQACLSKAPATTAALALSSSSFSSSMRCSALSLQARLSKASASTVVLARSSAATRSDCSTATWQSWMSACSPSQRCRSLSSK